MESFYMQVVKAAEAGYEPALVGLAHNKKQEPERMETVARKLAGLDGGHNKFLESMMVWLDVRAPRYWWQEADTFRLSTKQSESTMHTLTQELLAINISDPDSVDAFLAANFEPDSCSRETLRWIYEAADVKDILALKRRLPEGFLQKRMWCMSYKTLRNIILQRRTHRLPHWQAFITQTLAQVDHADLLPPLERKPKPAGTDQ
jgi:hypothetical protein